MKESRKPILILDANAFISCSKIHELGSKYRLLTTSDVIAELRDEKTKDYLQKIPFEV
jgi:rRNA maturation endonuclease Nob1